MYMCTLFLRLSNICLIFPWIHLLQIHPTRNMGALHEKQLLEVVADLCRFIMHEVIHLEGIFL
jgi:hypothetical protein